MNIVRRFAVPTGLALALIVSAVCTNWFTQSGSDIALASGSCYVVTSTSSGYPVGREFSTKPTTLPANSYITINSACSGASPAPSFSPTATPAPTATPLSTPTPIQTSVAIAAAASPAAIAIAGSKLQGVVVTTPGTAKLAITDGPGGNTLFIVGANQPAGDVPLYGTSRTAGTSLYVNSGVGTPAVVLQVLAAVTPSPTPTPTASPTPTATPTASPTPTATPT